MWVAKNDLTGQEYGDCFDNIYDCQRFIDTELLKIQMFYSLALGAEADFQSDYGFKKWYEKEYPKNRSVTLEITARIQYAMQVLFDGLPRNPRNNVIRCYNVEQKRYADGFDF